MAIKAYLVLKDSWINDKLFRIGEVAHLDEAQVAYRDDGTIAQTNLAEVDAKSMPEPAVVQMSAIGPTGPNPTAPQQIPPDAYQTLGGYAKPGAVLVGETTRTEAQKEAENLLDDESDAEEKAVEALAEARKEAAQADPLDHDLDGKKGGSRPRSTAAKS